MEPSLRVAVVHYHLKKGGVTRVIENTGTAFRDGGHPVELAVLTGPPANSKILRTTREIPDLGYTADGGSPDPDGIVRNLTESARDALGGDPDIWHIHNHSLGKNTAMPAVVERLADTGTPLLLHIHDFAEDSRPENYRLIRSVEGAAERLYPVAPHIGYAVLNGRDYVSLIAAGIPEAALYSLPNSVPANDPAEADQPAVRREVQAALPAGSTSPDHAAFYIYPVRATRRKNLGELVLWAAVAKARKDAAFFGNTLGPTNPNFETTYDGWIAYAEEHKLPVTFGFGAGVDAGFPEIIGAATGLLTTSVAEGFGLAFLEPWSFGKPLTGRDLPEITGDFAQKGISLDSLYERIDVPLDWIGGRGMLEQKIADALEVSQGAYGHRPGPDDVARALAAYDKGNRVDFGRLDEALQRTVIDRLLEDPGALDSMDPPALPELPSRETVEANRKAVQAEFSTAAYAERLFAIYRDLHEQAGYSQKIGFLDPNAVLLQFLDPARLNLLRT